MIRLFIRYLLASFSKRKKYFLYISYLYFSSHFPSNVLVKRGIFNYRIFPFFRGDYALRACIFVRFKMLAICESTRACSSSGTWLRVINRGANTGQMCVCDPWQRVAWGSPTIARASERIRPSVTGRDWIIHYTQCTLSEIMVSSWTWETHEVQ